MGKRVLMVATVPSMIGQFNMNNIKILQKLGYVVDVATNFTDLSVWPAERVQKFKIQLEGMGIESIQLNFSRNPLSIGRHIQAYKEALNLLEKRKYNFIHTHTPIASAIIRLAAHKTGTKVIYTAHGFHFYNGGPVMNWVIFYPIEMFLSRYTDVLITINEEDYRRAKDNFCAGRIEYISGVGVDLDKFKPNYIKQKIQEKRNEIGIPMNAKLLISVGELSVRKNHRVVIEALQCLPDNYWYIIAGEGTLRSKLLECDKTGRLKLLGQRADIVDLLHCSDLFVFPSLQEGLPVALMEAMAAGVNVVASNIRGNTDLLKTNLVSVTGDWKRGIEKSMEEDVSVENLKRIQRFSVDEVNRRMFELYNTIIK